MSWSDLFPEILSDITGRLKTRSDVHNFRAVCKNWCSSVSPSTPKTLPIFYQGCHLIREPDDPILAVNAVFILKLRNPPHSKPFLVTVQEYNNGKLQLFSPLTRNRIRRTEPLLLNISDFYVSLIATCLFWISSEHQPDECKCRTVCISDSAISFDSIDDNHAVNNNNNNTRFICIPRTGDVFMTGPLYQGYLIAENTRIFDDAVYFKRMVYVIDEKGRTYVFSDGLKWVKVTYVMDSHISGAKCIVSDFCSSCENSKWGRRRLVVDHSSDMLYLVETCERLHLKVYNLNEESRRWDEVSSLGKDRVLFLGVDLCFFASAAEFPGCRGNCIVFHKDTFLSFHGSSSFGKYESLFLGLSKELAILVFDLEDEYARLISTYPQFSDVVCPPRFPPWLMVSSTTGNSNEH